MNAREVIKLSRDCEGVQIPSGNKVKLPAGSQVRVTQSLGGSYTVITEEGFMVRIAGEDGDALGQAAPASSQASVSAEPKEPAEIEKLVWDRMRTCFDPEIPVNIVDLGLVYLCRVKPLPEGGNKVDVQMTLTAPGCGMGESLKEDVRSKILRLPGVKEAHVELVLEPPWNPSRMSEAAKLQLGML